MIKSSSLKEISTRTVSNVDEKLSSDESKIHDDLDLSLTRQNLSKSMNFSGSTSRSTTDSESSSSINISQVVDDDLSSLDDNNLRLLELQENLNIWRIEMPQISSETVDILAEQRLILSECQICLEIIRLRSSSCCSSNVCSRCLFGHLSSWINDGQIRINCPSCPHLFTRDEIIGILTETDKNGQLTERYKRFYADLNGETHIKTCPKCSRIKEFDKKLFEGIRWKKFAPRRVICDECSFIWCFICHAPWHEKMTCKEYQQGEKLLKNWALKKDQNQKNAQQCPRCKIYISRNGGCPHMICTKCHCDFCYNCGKRRYGIKFLGSHESRLSPFGCKYNLYPDKPILRHTVRGLVVGAATLAAPVAAVGAIALLAVGTTIGAPTYGTYRLVKHIKKKRRNRRFLPEQEISNDNQTRSFPSIDDLENDDLIRAIEESMKTYRHEREKHKETLSNAEWNDNDDDDDDDDQSFDE